ncbi:MAG: YhdP family protein [Rhodoferax sp.]|nr:YhdP family protein [Rhodoferax sp.]
MTDTFPAPSRLLVATGALAKWALRLVAGGWLVLALVWLALHFVIVPRIDDLRPWLEVQASRTFGAVVRIGSISAQSNGLIPSVELRGVQVLDAEGRVALELSSVIAAVSPRSLVAGGLEQLYIDSPVLDVQRKADGVIWVGGFALPQTDSGDSAGADWLFSQPELAIRHGTVRWTDALRQAPTLELSDVDLVLRNRHFTHSLRVNASPPAHWGERLSLQGVFTHPLLTLHAGRWQDWQGQWYTAFDRLDWAQLRPYLEVGVDVNQGRGSLRAWLDVKRAVITGATADLLLDDVHLGQGTQEQVLRRAAGRLAVKALEGGHEYSTEGLEFETAEGIRWPGGNARLALWDGQTEGKAKGAKLARGEFSADRLDVAVLAQLAQRLPLDAAWRAALQTYKPAGVVQTVQGGWTGSLEAPNTYAFKGRVTRAALAAQASVSPGLQGLDLDFDLTQTGGKARFAMANGSMDLAGWFAEPVLPLAQLSGDLQWKKDGARLNGALSNVRFANADTQGEVQSLKWSNADASGAVLPGPGMLELQATLSRAELARVHRYLPLSMDQEVRDYLRDAVRGGTASGAKLVLKGDLRQFPFAQAKQGEFKVSANLSNANYVYVPPNLLPKGSKPWPAFGQLSGELLLDRSTLSLKGVRAVWGGGAGQPGVPVERTEAQINNLYGASTVSVNAQGKGPLVHALAVVNGSAVDDLLDHALGRAVVSGAAEYRVRLDFPLADSKRMAINGAITLQGNDVQVLPGTPRLASARGQVSFTESGFGINGVVGQALGGEVRVDGTLTGFGDTSAPAGPGAGSASVAKPAPGVLRLQGTASAEGLRQASELGSVATSLARYASGTTNYQATMALRGGAPEIVVSSSLAGLGLNLPPPFAKTADAVVPLRLELGAARTGSGAGSAVLPGQSQIRLDWGRVASLALVTPDAGDAGRGLRGALAVGGAVGEPLVVPERGITANVVLDALDVDDWTAWLDGLAVAASSGKKSDGASMALLSDYLPSSMNLRVRELGWGSHVLHKVAVNGSRAGRLWRAQVDATEFSGQIEYRQASVPDLAADSANTGRLYARLSRLTLGSSEAQDVENLLDEQPASIPALDVVVDDFELLGKKLGRLEVEAVNQTSVVQREPLREWRLRRLNLSMPAAVLSATGTWRLQPGAATGTSMSAPGAAVKTNSRDRRRTALDFRLDINDSGDLLARFGMKDVIRQGRGKIEGQIEWQGSPISLDYPSLGGSFNVNLEKGEFLKADPGIAKLLGVLSLQSLPRRLMLDFRDVFAEGFPFDFVRGDVVIAKGMARTNNLQMKGVTAVVLMDGSTDIAKETQSIKVVVVPELNAGSASLITATINPLVGLYSFLAQLVLRQPLIAASTQELYIDGTWLEPRVTKVDRRPAAN